MSREVRHEAERAHVPITQPGLPELRRLLVEHDLALGVATTQMVPLTSVYWPMGGAERGPGRRGTARSSLL